MTKTYCVYMMTNRRNTVLYTGVTNQLSRRVHEHQTKADHRSFTARYNLDKLVYVEAFERIEEAIRREKQIKGGSRQRKEDMIAQLNPDWRDMSGAVVAH